MDCRIVYQFTLLLVGKEDLGLHVFPVLDVVVDNVGGEGFDTMVYAVFSQIFGHTSKKEVRPSVNLKAVSVLISFDVSQSLLQNCGVEKGVQSISRHAQCLHAAGYDLVIVVLLLRQVFY